MRIRHCDDITESRKHAYEIRFCKQIVQFDGVLLPHLLPHGWSPIHKNEPISGWMLHKDEPILEEIAREGGRFSGRCAAEVEERLKGLKGSEESGFRSRIVPNRAPICSVGWASARGGARSARGGTGILAASIRSRGLAGAGGGPRFAWPPAPAPACGPSTPPGGAGMAGADQIDGETRRAPPRAGSAGGCARGRKPG